MHHGQNRGKQKRKLSKERKLNENLRKLRKLGIKLKTICGNKGEFINFAEIRRRIYKFCGNKEENL